MDILWLFLLLGVFVLLVSTMTRVTVNGDVLNAINRSEFNLLNTPMNFSSDSLNYQFKSRITFYWRIEEEDEEGLVSLKKKANVHSMINIVSFLVILVSGYLLS